MTIAPTPVHGHSAPRIAVLVVAVAVVLGVTIALLIRNTSLQISFSAERTVGSGVAAVQYRHVPSFTGVDLAGSNNVTVHIGQKQSVVVHADDNLLQRVTTRVSAGTLVIGNTAGSFTTKTPMSVEITVPSLDTLDLSGSGNVTANDVKAEHLKVTLSGSGTLHASGVVSRLDVSHDGSGDIQLEQLVARDVHAVLTGSGRIVVHVTASLDGALHGSGAIVYFGNPAHVTKSVTGSGTIAGG